MTLAPVIIVMAKAPRPGLVKTRLIPALGPVGAAALARRLLDHALAQARQARLGTVELCVAPDPQDEAFAELRAQADLRWVAQGEGDLGQRMQRAFERQDGPALMIGTDAPGLGAFQLQQAARALQTHEAVFVPAHDGGYALIGLRRPVASLFGDMPWSTSRVMALTRERLYAAGLTHWEAPPVHDIDEPEDLVHLPPTLHA